MQLAFAALAILASKQAQTKSVIGYYIVRKSSALLMFLWSCAMRSTTREGTAQHSTAQLLGRTLCPSRTVCCQHYHLTALQCSWQHKLIARFQPLPKVEQGTTSSSQALAGCAACLLVS